MEYIFQIVVFLVLGLVLGSFMTSLTYRWPRELSVAKGRSKCPNCGHQISWYDNIPVLSFLILRGKCRYCKVSISPRYILIELFTGILFAGTFVLYSRCDLDHYYFCSWTFHLGSFALPFLLLNIFLLIAIFIIDLEHQLILDEIVFFGFLITLAAYFVSSVELYPYVFSAFGAATALLLLNLVTKGKGMGLGDVKYALYGGMFFKPLDGVVWMFMSFIIGAFVGVVLIAFGKSKFGQKIAFGPFLVISMVISLVLMNRLRFF